MKDHDAPDILHFVAPPCVHETRVISGKYYRHEMDNEQHLALLDSVLKLEGKVVICGYETEMYNDILIGWQKGVKAA